jgi:hypothetical protein
MNCWGWCSSGEEKKPLFDDVDLVPWSVVRGAKNRSRVRVVDVNMEYNGVRDYKMISGTGYIGVVAFLTVLYLFENDCLA